MCALYARNVRIAHPSMKPYPRCHSIARGPMPPAPTLPEPQAQQA